MRYNRQGLKWIIAACCFLPFSLKARTEAKPVSQDKPLSFIENVGQIIDQHGKQRKDIDYKLSVPGMNIFIGNGQIHYQWNRPVGNEQLAVGSINKHNGSIPDVKAIEKDKQAAKVETYRMDVTLVGANLNTPATAQEVQAYTERYYTQQFGEKGGLAHTYNTVVYKNVYPNIDWVLYTKNGTLKYDFIVHPGGNPKNIQLKYGGATTLALKDGAITATTPFGSVTEQQPFTYDQQTKREIASKFVLTDNTLSFDIATHEGTLIIDPAITWATYYGGSNNDQNFGLTADASGYAYLSGWTTSFDNIATNGAYQTTLNSGIDGFLVKFNAAGVRQWSSYYGDAGTDYFQSVALDPGGNIYCSGITTSTSGIATSGAHQTTFGGNSSGDAMLVKFTNGGARIWATYYGGSNSETGNHVVCDNSGNAFLSGTTSSSNNIATTGAYQMALSGGGSFDAFIVKFNASGVRQWGTYYGGTTTDGSYGSACDVNGNIYICGGTQSSSGIATTGTYQTTFAGSEDGFIAKFSSTGSIVWGTYYGGSGVDRLLDILIDNSGNIYVSGWTYSTSGIATTGAYQTTIGGIDDGLIVKFNASGVRQWGTYYGGSGNDYTQGLAINSGVYLYVSGRSGSLSGIATTGAYQTTIGGNLDVILIEMNAVTGYPSWATYFGGWNSETADASNCAWSPAGYIYISGTTYSNNGIATPGAHQTLINGSGGLATITDAFLAAFTPDTAVYIKQPYTDTSFCPGDSFKVAYGVTYNFKSGNTFTVQLSDASGNFTSPVNIGSKAISTGDTIKCQIPAGTQAGTGYRIRIVSSSPVRTSIDNGVNIRVRSISVNATNNGPLCEGVVLNLSATAASTTGTVTYSWIGPNSFSSTSQNPIITNIATTQTGDYVITATNGNCIAKDTTTVVVNIIPGIPTAGSNSPICSDSTIKLTASSTTAGVSYIWSGPVSFSSTQQNPTIGNATTANDGTYSVKATLNGCTSPTGITSVTVYSPIPIPIANSNTPVCEGGPLTLTAGTVAGATYVWTGPNGFTSNLQNPVIDPAFASNAGNYIIKAIINGCYSKPGTALVTITGTAAAVGAYASPNDTVCTGMITTFVAIPSNAGSNPQFQWFKNGIAIPGATGTVYNTTNLVTGDSLYCRMTATGVCATPLTLFTNGIKMVVHSVVVVPSVTISSTPSQPIPGQQVVFYATPVNGGPFPAYQWRRNGQDILGAISANWSANNLHPYDEISCVLTSSDSCAQPKTDTSNEIVVNFPVSINNLNNADEVSVYPNPNNGNFTIQTKQQGVLYIYNMPGQLLGSYEVKQEKTNISLPASLTPGIYTGRFVNSKNEVIVLRIDYRPE